MNIQKIVKLPENWEQQSASYKIIISDTNKLLSNKDFDSINRALKLLFEIVYGTLEYLESNAILLLKNSNNERLMNNVNIKSYEDQLLSLMVCIEDICKEYPELATDRYLLYLEIFNKMLYVNLDAVSAFKRFLTKVISKINIKKINEFYAKDFIIFGSEIAILSKEANKFAQTQEIYLELSGIVESSHINTVEFIIPLIGLAISYETRGNYQEASNVYFKALTRINGMLKLNRKDLIPLQLIHETLFFGYITAIIGDNFDKHGNEFYSFLYLCEENVANLLRAIHSILFFGFTIENSFNSQSRTAYDLIDFYLLSSIVQSNQPLNPNGLRHISADSYLKIIETKSRIRGAQEGILIVESKNLKGIQIYSDKKLLPSLNVYPGELSNYVILNDVRFNVNNQFAFGMSFVNEIEIVVNFQKKNIIKKKFSVKDKIPPFFVIDLTDELDEARILKEGGEKHFNTIWSDHMPLTEVIRSIIDMDEQYFMHKSENKQKNFLKEVSHLFKKINLKNEEKVINELLKQESTYSLKGKTLKIFILQRLASLDVNNPEITNLIELVVK